MIWIKVWIIAVTESATGSTSLAIYYCKERWIDAISKINIMPCLQLPMAEPSGKKSPKCSEHAY